MNWKVCNCSLSIVFLQLSYYLPCPQSSSHMCISQAQNSFLLFITNNLNRDTESETGKYQSLRVALCFILLHQANIIQESPSLLALVLCSFKKQLHKFITWHLFCGVIEYTVCLCHPALHLISFVCSSKSGFRTHMTEAHRPWIVAGEELQSAMGGSFIQTVSKCLLNVQLFYNKTIAVNKTDTVPVLVKLTF